jgi:hypothetical protein
MTEIYIQVSSYMPQLSEGRPDFCSEVFWFARGVMLNHLERQRDLCDDLVELPAGMTTKADKQYSAFTIRHILDKFAAVSLTNTLDQNLPELARAIIKEGNFSEVKPFLVKLIDLAYASELEEKMCRSRMMSMRASGYKKLYECSEVLLELIEEHAKSRYAMVGALAGHLIAFQSSPLSYPSSQIIPFFSVMRIKGEQYE